MDEIQRARLFEAMCIAIVEEGGFGKMAVTDILDRAGMSNKTFYDYFDNKDACVLAAQRAYALFDSLEDWGLAAYGILAARLQAALEAVCQLEDSWPAKVRAAIGAALAFAAREPAAAQFLAVEIQAGGPQARTAQVESIDRLAAGLGEGRDQYPAAAGLNPATEYVIVAGVVSLIGNRLLTGQAERLPDCESELVELALAPYLGAGKARPPARS
jgi:AcrR family transcriptional regulator